MPTLDLTQLPVGANAAILAVGGAVVCFAGTKLARHADAISAQSRLSEALAGALLLGVATSLPEIVTTVTSGMLGNAALAVNNLFGGVAMQLVVLAAIDFWFVRRGPLTFFSPAPVLLLGGVLLILQLALAIVAFAAGDVQIVVWIGGWPVFLFAVYLATLYFMNRFTGRATWTAARLPDEYEEDEIEEAEGRDALQEAGPLRRHAAWFALHCVLVILGGVAVSTSADALSSQTGLGSGFIGATLVAVTTSLPEISTTAGAVRPGAYTMAIANIFGTNTLEVALLLIADLGYRDGAIVNAVDRSSLAMASVAIVLTALYLWGLLERRDKSYFNMGVDSILVVLVYIAALAILYRLSGG